MTEAAHSAVRLPKRQFRVGIDIGGTFTDIVATGTDGAIFVKKTSSTPQDYSLGSCRGVQELMQENGIGADEVDVVVHATTMATNAGKMACYAPAHSKVKMRYGSLEQCVDAAITGVIGLLTFGSLLILYSLLIHLIIIPW